MFVPGKLLRLCRRPPRPVSSSVLDLTSTSYQNWVGKKINNHHVVSVLVFVINWVVGSHHPKTGVSILDDENQQPPSYSISQYGIRIKHPRTFGSKTVQLNAAVFFRCQSPHRSGVPLLLRFLLFFFLLGLAFVLEAGVSETTSKLIHSVRCWD